VTLAGRVAVVAGATRGAGRGIACMLGAAGAAVYCTGRSTRDHAATPGRSETIEETAERVTEHGGTGIAVRTDHTREDEVVALFERVQRERGRLDILVNDVWGGDTLIDWSAKFWTLDMGAVRTLMERAIYSHLLTSRHGAPLMVAQKSGLIVEITDGNLGGYRGQVLYDLVKASINRLGYTMAWDLLDSGVTALTVSPGFLRSEAILEGFGVTEANWRDGIKSDPLFAESETPFYVGRAVAALAADPKVSEKSGAAFFAADLASEYGFTDVDGRTPHFWRGIDQHLATLARSAAPLEPQTRWLMQHRYSMIHREPARRNEAEALAAKLELDLGDGLRPIQNVDMST
jgi:NAD(P)-dependent dehydrogenase (short-subunit alcohol dehydrogenase family)